ncbi:MAG: VCBS repeat-containing protein [Kibdelosporangium sp.]
MKVIGVFLGLAGVLALAAPSAAAPAQVIANPDLDGDGKADTVIAKPSADNPAEQVLLATVRGRLMYAHLPYDSYVGVEPMRVVDVNGDGKQEVVVTEYVGANTLQLSIWGLRTDRIRVMTDAGQTPLKIFDGGGISSINKYGCETTGNGRRFVTVSALYDWDTGLYTGARITYSVRDGVATETSRTTATGPVDSVVFQLDSATCG